MYHLLHIFNKKWGFIASLIKSVHRYQIYWWIKQCWPKVKFSVTDIILHKSRPSQNVVVWSGPGKLWRECIYSLDPQNVVHKPGARGASFRKPALDSPGGWVWRPLPGILHHDPLGGGGGGGQDCQQDQRSLVKIRKQACCNFDFLWHWCFSAGLLIQVES